MLPKSKKKPVCFFLYKFQGTHNLYSQREPKHSKKIIVSWRADGQGFKEHTTSYSQREPFTVTKIIVF